MAMTAYDLCTEKALLASVRDEFENWKKRQA